MQYNSLDKTEAIKVRAVTEMVEEGQGVSPHSVTTEKGRQKKLPQLYLLYKEEAISLSSFSSRRHTSAPQDLETHRQVRGNCMCTRIRK